LDVWPGRATYRQVGQVGTQDAAIPTFLFHISHIFPAKTSIVIKKCRQFLFFVVPRQFSQDTIASGQKIKF